MSVSQLWLQLVGQILKSSIHHVDTGEIMCVFGIFQTMEGRQEGENKNRHHMISTRKISQAVIRCSIRYFVRVWDLFCSGEFYPHVGN